MVWQGLQLAGHGGSSESTTSFWSPNGYVPLHSLALRKTIDHKRYTISLM